MNLRKIASEYVLGFLSVDDLPATGRALIEGGCDSPLLRQLAGETGEDLDEVRRLFLGAMRELGVEMPSVRDAGSVVAQAIASEVIAGAVTPYDGAKKIWDRLYTRWPELDQLRPFVGLASEYEDDANHREEYARDILAECEKLIASAPQLHSPGEGEKGEEGGKGKGEKGVTSEWR